MNKFGAEMMDFFFLEILEIFLRGNKNSIHCNCVDTYNVVVVNNYDNIPDLLFLNILIRLPTNSSNHSVQQELST